MTFKELGLNSQILETITKLGFTEPTPIQAQAIPVLLQGGRDFIGLAQTGTGKTAAFGLPMIQKIDTQNKQTQALILAPTRELCLQITKELERFCAHERDIMIAPIYGGVDIEKQIRQLKKGAQIVVGTPGRMVDHIKRKTISLETVRIAALDEADEMLNMGFQEDINIILAKTPSDKQTWLFSATMPASVERISKNYMTDPVKVTVGSKNSSAKNIQHQYCVTQARSMYDALKRFVDAQPGLFGILFCRTRHETKSIVEKLIKEGYHADALHGELSQGQRDTVMKKFRSKNLQLLVATDVAARGIDVSDVTHVFHFSLPEDAENYTHRSGRTARAGKSGISIALINTREVKRIRYIENIIGQKISKVEIPSGEEICQKQIEHRIDVLFNETTDSKILEPYMEKILTKLDGISAQELIQRVLTLEFNNLISTYKNALDLNNQASAESFRGTSRGNRLFINVGKMDGFSKRDFIDLIATTADVQDSQINNVDLDRKFSFFAVDDSTVAQKIVQAFSTTTHNNRRIRVEFTTSSGQDRAPSSRPRDRDREMSPYKRKSNTSSMRPRRTRV